MRRPVKPFVTEYKAPNRRSSGRNGEDLFSTAGNGEPASRRSSDAGTHGENAYEAAMKAADAIFSPVIDRSREVEDASAPQRNEPSVEAADAPAPARRILRAMDEPPPPEVIDFQEPPRRRGRKPGSKNKPKLVVAEAEAPPDFVEQENDDLEDEDDVTEIATAPSPTFPSVPYRSRNSERFPWVRTKLKPGEQWKRRLPKVCW